jgi:hypothetical protein
VIDHVIVIVIVIGSVILIEHVNANEPVGVIACAVAESTAHRSGGHEVNAIAWRGERRPPSPATTGAHGSFVVDHVNANEPAGVISRSRWGLVDWAAGHDRRRDHRRPAPTITGP